MAERSSVFTASHGVMTTEVGVISGELELRTNCDNHGLLTLRITYHGADEWYTLPGNGHRLHDPRDHEVVHRILATVLARP
ncbi:hypothetical protein FHU38_002218 [Saccharomonospora amisosensis]|uniref:Uncharacterized protein n=1 Tax=Saccharomonospora amisosensis TaxID=1128677 RepID=A0A7X5ZQI4_9PSEU|nr:hypothetical protein [Saccharomonospora amisosensis]NIJ11874.1 hypothetical protein [Saccharomonospora amisosensis]